MLHHSVREDIPGGQLTDSASNVHGMTTVRARISAALISITVLATGCAPSTPAPTSSQPSASGATSSAPAASARPTPSAGMSTSAPAAGLRLTAAGDFGATANTRAVLAGMNEAKPLAALFLGDFSYGKNGQEGKWCDLVNGLTPDAPKLLVSGNHESNGRNGRIQRFLDCLPNTSFDTKGDYARQYYVDLPASRPLVRVVMISPGVDFGSGPWRYTKGSPRYQWTAQAIDGARSAGIPWVIVGMHRPCVSTGIYPCVPGADIQQLLLDKHVDLVVTGHEHFYQRSKQLRSGTAACRRVIPATYDADCVIDSDDTLVKSAGTVFISAGTGGTGLRRVVFADPEYRYFATASGTNQMPTHGFLQLDITGTELRASFDNAGTGTYTDGFTISGS